MSFRKFIFDSCLRFMGKGLSRFLIKINLFIPLSGLKGLILIVSHFSFVSKSVLTISNKGRGMRIEMAARICSNADRPKPRPCTHEEIVHRF